MDNPRGEWVSVWVYFIYSKMPTTNKHFRMIELSTVVILRDVSRKFSLIFFSLCVSGVFSLWFIEFRISCTHFQWVYQWICTDLESCCKNWSIYKAKPSQIRSIFYSVIASTTTFLSFSFIHSTMRNKNKKYWVGSWKSKRKSYRKNVDIWKIFTDVKQCTDGIWPRI